jgi:hypothetical protein
VREKGGWGVPTKRVSSFLYFTTVFVFDTDGYEYMTMHAVFDFLSKCFTADRSPVMVVVDDLKKISGKEQDIMGCVLYAYFLLQLVFYQ